MVNILKRHISRVRVDQQVCHQMQEKMDLPAIDSFKNVK